MRLSDVPATIGLIERALALLPDAHRLRPRLLAHLGYSFRDRGDLDAAAAAFEQGLAAAERVDDRASGALIEARVAALRGMQGATVEATLAALRPLAEELETLGDEESLAEVLFLVGQYTSWAEQDATEVLEHGARLAHKLGNLRLEASCIGWLSIDAFWYHAPLEEGLELCDRLLSRPDAGAEVSRLLVVAGNLKRLAGREQEGMADIENATRQLMELGRTVDAHAFSMATASVSILDGRFEGAEKTLRPASDALKAFGEKSYLSTVSAVLAFAIAAQGRYEEAQPLIEEARAFGAVDDVATHVYCLAAQARILAGRGEHEAARGLSDETLDRLGSRRVLDIITLLENAADIHRLAGRPDEAKEALEQSLELREKKGIVLGDARVHELLAGT
jgi:tetratricopeptide (TPR) repeat protein